MNTFDPNATLLQAASGWTLPCGDNSTKNAEHDELPGPVEMSRREFFGLAIGTTAIALASTPTVAVSDVAVAFDNEPAPLTDAEFEARRLELIHRHRHEMRQGASIQEIAAHRRATLQAYRRYDRSLALAERRLNATLDAIGLPYHERMNPVYAGYTGSGRKV